MKTYECSEDDGAMIPFNEIKVGDFFIDNLGNCFIKISSSLALEPYLRTAVKFRPHDPQYVPSNITIICTEQV